MPKLVITDSDGSRTLALEREVKAGRLAENEVQLKVPEASRHHCRFFDEKGTWFVEDMGSSNGTLVNGRKVSKFELQDGDLISVGAVTMRFLDSAPTAEERGDADSAWGSEELSLETETFLVLGAPGRVGEVVRIAGDKLTVGRRSKNDLVIAEPSVSQDHAEIRKTGDGWVVRDLGSSNGTFVDGDRVTEAALASGAVVTFGEIAATFGVGEPAQFSAPEPAVVERAQTKMVATESAFADPTFALREVPEKKSPVPSILAALLLLGLAGGLVWLYMNRERLSGGPGGSQGGSVRVVSNMVPAAFWSFESRETDLAAEDATGWHKEDAIDASSAGEVTDPAHSGDMAFSISRREAGPPTVVLLSGGIEADIGVSAGTVYRLSGWVWVESGDPVPGIGVSWIDVAADQVREVAYEMVPAAPQARRWTEVAGFVRAPEGATRAHVAIALGGVGDAVFDDIVLDAAQAPPGRAAEVHDFRAWIAPSGALRVFHFARPVSDGIGLWKADESLLVPPGQVLIPQESSAPGLSGTLREGGGTASVALTAAAHSFQATWQLSGVSQKHALGIPLGGAKGEVNVTLLDGDRAKRMRTTFEKQPASGVIVGGQGDRMRIRFLDGEGKPFTAPLDVVTSGDRAVLRLERGDRSAISFLCELSFDAELTTAREMLNQAAAAGTKGRVGEAVGLYEEVLARFPFDENLEKQASSSLERLMNDGRALAKSLAARVDDAKFYRTARLEDDLLAELESGVARYSGTNLQADFAARRDELKAERTRSAAEKRDAEARASFMRAQDYLASKLGRREVAVAFLEMLIARYPDTEWGDRARQVLEKVKAEARPETRAGN